MNFRKTSIPLLLCGILFLLSAESRVAAVSSVVSNEKLASPERLLEPNSSDGTSIISSMLDKTKQIKAYSLDTVLNTIKGNKLITETGKLYFKSPDLIRFEVLSAGKRSGAVVVRQSDGKIKGKMGGALSGIKVTLSPDSKLLKSANDFSVLESDLQSLLAKTLEKLNSKNLCLAGNVPGIPSQIIELVDSDGTLVSRMTIDARNKLPEDWSMFQDNKLFSNAKFVNLKILADLPDSTFKLEAPGKTEAPTLIASQRGIEMSLAEYKLQMESMRLQEQSEMLANDLDSLLSNGPEAAKMSMIARALATISAETNTIMETMLEPKDGTSSWSPGSRERLVVAATQIELLLSAIEKASNTAHKSSENAKGDEAITNCLDTISFLIDQTYNDHPNIVHFEELKSSLKKYSSQVIESHL